MKRMSFGFVFVVGQFSQRRKRRIGRNKEVEAAVLVKLSNGYASVSRCDFETQFVRHLGKPSVLIFKKLIRRKLVRDIQIAVAVEVIIDPAGGARVVAVVGRDSDQLGDVRELLTLLISEQNVSAAVIGDVKRFREQQ